MPSRWRKERLFLRGWILPGQYGRNFFCSLIFCSLDPAKAGRRRQGFSPFFERVSLHKIGGMQHTVAARRRNDPAAAGQSRLEMQKMRTETSSLRFFILENSAFWITSSSRSEILPSPLDFYCSQENTHQRDSSRRRRQGFSPFLNLLLVDRRAPVLFPKKRSASPWLLSSPFREYTGAREDGP